MKLQVAEIFGSYMVLQQQKPLQIWGKGNAGKLVSVVIQEKKGETIVESNGCWQVTIPALKVSESETLIIKSESEEIVFNDVAVGEVWLAAGQSNMEFFMRYDKDLNEEITSCQNKNIRFFDYPVVRTMEQRLEEPFTEFGFWRKCDEENLQYYSAVAYYFARDLQKDLGIPIGIVGCNCGGSRACCWMNETTVEKYGKVWLDDYNNGLKMITDMKAEEASYNRNPMADKAHPFANPITDQMLYGLSVEELTKIFAIFAESGASNVIGPWHEWRPCGLYHTMLEQIIPYTIRGVIYYQGESDEDHPEIYADMMCGLIQDWRERWGEEFPFLMTQLAPFGEVMGNGGKYYPILRNQQEEVTRRISNVWCASIGDVGNEFDIHPKEKQPVGKRLALLARGHVYQESILCDAPEAKKIVVDKSVIRIQFSNAEGDLILKGTEVQGLKLYAEQKLIEADEYQTIVSGEEVSIAFHDSKIAETLTEIEYANSAYYEVNLYNAANIPAKPFCWKLTDQGGIRSY